MMPLMDMLGKNKEAEEDDICDQICLAQLLIAYGRADVDAIYPLVHPGGLRDEVSQIRGMLENEIKANLE